MTAPTICGRKPERVVDWLEWRFGPWVLATRDGIGCAHYCDGDWKVKVTTTPILMHNYGSDAKAAAGLESWLRLMVSTTCESMGLEVRELEA